MSANGQSSPTHGHGLHVVIPASSAPAADEHTPAPAAHAQTPLAQSAGGIIGHPHELGSTHGHPHQFTNGHPHQFTQPGQGTPGHPHEFHFLQGLSQPSPIRGHNHQFLRDSQTPTDGHNHQFFALLFHGRAEAGSPTLPRPSPRVMRRSSLFTEQEDEPLGAAADGPMLPATTEAFEKEEGGSSQESVSQVEDSERA